MNEQNEIVLYQPNELTKLEVRVADDTVWLTQAQMAELFDVNRQAITKHLKNIYDSQELQQTATCSILELVQLEGNRTVKREVGFYNLDVIISVGFRVNTVRGIQFRQWANRVLKDYTLRGYAINQRLVAMEERIDRRLTQHEQTLAEHQDKIDFFIRTSLPPVEGVFYEGQIFDAYLFVSDLIQSATQSVILIDNYVDANVLTWLDKRKNGVKATIYTHTILTQLRLDIEKHNAQYQPIEVYTCKNNHDRFLLIDDTVYHVGASIKDLGKKLFAFSKMEISAKDILKHL